MSAPAHEHPNDSSLHHRHVNPREKTRRSRPSKVYRARDMESRTSMDSDDVNGTAALSQQDDSTSEGEPHAELPSGRSQRDSQSMLEGDDGMIESEVRTKNTSDVGAEEFVLSVGTGGVKSGMGSPQAGESAHKNDNRGEYGTVGRTCVRAGTSHAPNSADTHYERHRALPRSGEEAVRKRQVPSQERRPSLVFPRVISRSWLTVEATSRHSEGGDYRTPAAPPSASPRARQAPPRFSSSGVDYNFDDTMVTTEAAGTRPTCLTRKCSGSKGGSAHSGDRAVNTIVTTAAAKLWRVASTPERGSASRDSAWGCDDGDQVPRRFSLSYLSRGEEEAAAAAAALSPERIRATSAPGRANPLQLPRELISEDDSDDYEEVAVPFFRRPSAVGSGRRQQHAFLSTEDDREEGNSMGGDEDCVFGGRGGPDRSPANRRVGPFSRWRSTRSMTTRSSLRDPAAERDEFLTFTLPRQTSTASTAAPSPWARTPGKRPTGNRADEMDNEDHLWGYGGASVMPRVDWLRGWSNNPNTTAERQQVAYLGRTGSSRVQEERVEIDRLHGWGKRTASCDGCRSSPTPSAGRLFTWWQREISRFSDRCQRIEAGNDRESDGAPSFRVWHWWNNLRRTPGLVARFLACLLALSALWLTSLIHSVELAGLSLISPTFHEVISVVVHAFRVIEEQREAHERCVVRQSVYCDDDMNNFEVLAREQAEASTATTAATLEHAREWTTSCNASIQEAQDSLKTWIAQGIGYVMLYSTNCTRFDEELVAGLLGDVSSSRDEIGSLTEKFGLTAATTVAELSSHAVERSAYDLVYVANKSSVVNVDADRVIYNMTFEVRSSLNATFQRVGELGDVLIACVSLRGDEDDACPGENARTLADKAREQLDLQLASARNGFEAYAVAFEQYAADVGRAYDNMVEFYSGAMLLLGEDVVAISSDSAWSKLSLDDFFTSKPTIPSSNGILTGYPDVATVEEIWHEVNGAYDDFEEGTAAVGTDIRAQVMEMSSEWKNEAAQAVANISVAFDLNDYDPPSFGNTSSENDSNMNIELTDSTFRATADAFSARTLDLLDSLGPRGFNLSLPASPPLNSSFVGGNTSTVFQSNIASSFASFTPLSMDFYLPDWWPNIGFLLLAADIFFRLGSSVRLLIRFWNLAGLGLPDADLRVDKNISKAKTLGGDLIRGAARVIAHPITTQLFFVAIAVLVFAVLRGIYAPFLSDYVDGCVERTQNGSKLTQNLYSSAYNYATEKGNNVYLNYQSDHNSRRADLCVEMTAGLRQYLYEVDAELKGMYENHQEDVTVAVLLRTCLDTNGMNDLFAEACCGHDSYNSTCATNTTYECPLTYASGVGKPFAPVGTTVSNDDCAEDTLDTVHWQVESGIELDCETVFPACEMTCAGPSKELLRVATLHAGCTVECFIHVGIIKTIAIVVVFVFMNMSRVILFSGFIKLNWRLLHAGIYTYNGTCTRAGELIAFDSEQKEANRGHDVAGDEDAAQPHDGMRGLASSTTPERRRRATRKRIGAWFPPGSPFRHGRDDEASGRSSASVGNKQAAEGVAITRPGGFDETQVSASAQLTGGEKGDKRRGSCDKRTRPASERVIADAVEESIRTFERGAHERTLCGALLNLPWILVLWWTRRGKLVYNPT